MTTAAERMTATPTGRPPPRLHLQPNLQPTLSRRTLLDGGWWPRSTDPVGEAVATERGDGERRFLKILLLAELRGNDDFFQRAFIGGQHAATEEYGCQGRGSQGHADCPAQQA